MEATYTPFIFTCGLLFLTLVSIVLLVLSTKGKVVISEKTGKEKQLMQERRRMEKAERAVLKHQNLKAIKHKQKIIKIGKLPHVNQHDEKVRDLRERRFTKRHKTKLLQS